MNVSQSPGTAPEYQLYRIVTAADSGPHTDRALGVNCGGRRTACVQIVPIASPNPPSTNLFDPTGATSNPTVVIRFWSHKIGRFIVHNPTIAPAAAGAGVAAELTIDVAGRIMMVEVTGGVTGGQAVAIFVATHEFNESI